MRFTKSPLNVSVCASLVLGQVSMWLGTFVAVGWVVLFSIMARHVWTFRGDPASLALPLEPPMIGLTLGTFGAMLAVWSRHPISVAAVTGVLLNGVALALALALMAGCLG